MTPALARDWARGHGVPAGMPTAEQIGRAAAWYQLIKDILAVLDGAPAWMSEDGKTATLGDALADREILAPDWCVRCRLARSGECGGHVAGLALVDEYRRLAYRRLPGKPLIEADLPDEPRHLRLVR